MQQVQLVGPSLSRSFHIPLFCNANNGAIVLCNLLQSPLATVADVKVTRDLLSQ